MFDYSRAAIAIILEDIKKWSKIFKIVFSIFTLLYLSYSIIVDNGIFHINIALISLYVIYTILELVTYRRQMKRFKKIVERSYKWSALSLKAFTLGTLLYGVYVGTHDLTGLSMILTTLMIILWTLQVLLEIIIFVMEPKVKLMLAGILYDAKPYINIANFVKKESVVVNYEEFEKEYDILKKKINEMKPKKVRKKLIPFEIKIPQINILGLFKKPDNKIKEIEEKK